MTCKGSPLERREAGRHGGREGRETKEEKGRWEGGGGEEGDRIRDYPMIGLRPWPLEPRPG